MKRIRFALTLTMMLALIGVASICISDHHALAQTTPQLTSIEFQVAVEMANGETITVPVQIDAAPLYGLMGYPPTNAVVDALLQLSGQTLDALGIAESTTDAEPMSDEETAGAVEAGASEEGVSDKDLLVDAPTEFGDTTSGNPFFDVTPLPLGTATRASDSDALATTDVAHVVEPSVTNANAYQRTSPTIDSAILGQLPAETDVYVDGRNADGEWLHLDNGSWVARFLLDNVPASLPIIVEGATTADNTVPATVIGDSVILRDGPSQSNVSVGMYNAGIIAAVLSRASTGDWLEVVMSDGVVGWMAAEYLDVAEDVDALPVVVTVGDRDIYGSVIDSAGLGVDGAVLSAVPTDGPSDYQQFATSAGDGSFIMTVPDDGTLEWSVWIDDLGCESRLMNDRCQLFGYYLLTPHIEIELPLDEPLKLVYADATSFIAGTVVDDRNAPKGAGVHVTAFRDDGAMTEGTTASSGKFVLPADAGTWDVSTEYGPSVTVNVEAGSAPDPIEVPSN